MNKSILRQLPIKFSYAVSYNDLKDMKLVCWFYGSEVLGTKDHRREPYILAVRWDEPFLYKPDHYDMEHTTLKIGKFEVPFAVVR